VSLALDGLLLSSFEALATPVVDVLGFVLRYFCMGVSFGGSLDSVVVVSGPAAAEAVDLHG
jgi:hypothetical protein